MGQFKLFTLFVVSMIFIAACQPAPAPEPTQAPATPTASGPDLLEFPRVACCDGRAVAGLYKLPRWFSPTVTVEIPDDSWRGVTENSIETVYMIRGESAESKATEVLAFFEVEAGDSVEQFQVALMDSPQLTLLGDPSPTTIAGFDAWVIDAQVLPDPDFEGNAEADVPPGTQRISVFEEYFTTTFYFWYTFTPEARIRVYTLHNGHQDLVFYLEAAAADFDAFAADAEAILQTLTVVE